MNTISYSKIHEEIKNKRFDSIVKTVLGVTALFNIYIGALIITVPTEEALKQLEWIASANATTISLGGLIAVILGYQLVSYAKCIKYPVLTKSELVNFLSKTRDPNIFEKDLSRYFSVEKDGEDTIKNETSD